MSALKVGPILERVEEPPKYIPWHRLSLDGSVEKPMSTACNRKEIPDVWLIGRQGMGISWRCWSGGCLRGSARDCWYSLSP